MIVSGVVFFLGLVLVLYQVFRKRPAPLGRPSGPVRIPIEDQPVFQSTEAARDLIHELFCRSDNWRVMQIFCNAGRYLRNPEFYARFGSAGSTDYFFDPETPDSSVDPEKGDRPSQPPCPGPSCEGWGTEHVHQWRDEKGGAA